MISSLRGRQLWLYSSIILAVLLYLSVYGVRIYIGNRNNPEHIFLEFKKDINTLETNTKNNLDFFIANIDTISEIWAWPKVEVSEDKWKEDGTLLFVYKKDSLIYWNNNSVILPANFCRSYPRANFACKLKNGWYDFYFRKSGSFLFFGGYLIKNIFPFQNEFLRNQFSPGCNIPASVSITEKIGPYAIYSKDKTYLFSLSFNNYFPEPDGFYGLIFLLFISGSICFLYFLFIIISEMDWYQTRENLLVITYCSAVVILRLIQNYSGFPSEIYHSELFSPAWYSSSSFLPSLGDFTLNIAVLLLISLVIYKKVTIHADSDNHKLNWQFIRNAVLLFILLVFFHGVGYLVTSLVINSSLSLNLQNISGLTYESGFGLFITATLLFSFWLVSLKAFDVIYSTRPRIKGLGLAVMVAVCLFTVFTWIAGWDSHIIISLFFLAYLFLCWFFKVKQRGTLTIQNLLIFLCFYSLFATFLLNKANKIKEKEKINLLAVKLATRRNPVTEVLYEQVEQKLNADSVLNKLINSDNGHNLMFQDSLISYLKTQYFKDYWKKYQIQITCCDPAKELRIQPQGYLVNCNAYFQDIITNYGEATILPNLYFLDYGPGKEYYLALLSRKLSGTNAEMKPAIFIEFNLRNAYPDPGYPGLLMDKTRIDFPNTTDYSYALYQNGRLVRAVGANGYKTELKKYNEIHVKSTEFKEDHVVNHQYKINDTDTLLISKKEDDLFTFATPFSYLFILFSALTIVGAGLLHLLRHSKDTPASLRSRLHFSLIGILLTTMLAIGIVQIINIIQINSKKNIDNLRERASSIVGEVQHKYGPTRELREVENSEMEDFLIKLSNIFFTDINVYYESGQLMASSRSQIFEEGLLSDKMNPEAYQKMAIEKNSSFIHNESIGRMQFKSAYLPFYNEYNRLLGFVNLPYFAKQDESKKEISSFLVTFLNVYILLILFGVVVTILVSNYITSPVAMLSKKLSQIRLGMVNEKIHWKQNDEIGQLVSVYNRMVDELAMSAEMLARSERESAWREMARQVAHEIKNPLTPMKLSAQYLEKAWKEKAPDWDTRLARFTKTLVEQIDALSLIASDFSDFAKMQTVVMTRIDLEEVILFVLSMYQDTTSIQYEFLCEVAGPSIVADRSQLIRVFTNLLNNAIQAIDNRQDGLIRIHVAKAQSLIVIKITDNGCGIAPEQNGRIFQPDFTTKTSGMGLGLAIVKGIVEEMKGEISFTSAEYQGTTFIIKFPVNNED